ncbi:MAG TPA: outer membrane beta-barrel protein [Vicinamibacterales bacterium]|jgi:opacity protein-like surface antigen|nr:outer membrane beta-barrel protein [Vicinamibacterales bacterium]
MKRFGQVMVAVVLGTMWTAHAAQAQTADHPWAAQVDGAATLGQSSSSSFGGEVDRRLGGSLDVTVEAGAMKNITSSALQGRANIIGQQIGATANPIQKATYYDIGLKYRLMPDGKWNPYVSLGVGGARVSTTTTFTQAGAVLSDAQLAANFVALGADLDGHIMKPFATLGLGLQVPVGQKFFLDGSFRYGRVFPRTSEIDGDKAVNASRVQIGLGIRF